MDLYPRFVAQLMCFVERPQIANLMKDTFLYFDVDPLSFCISLCFCPLLFLLLPYANALENWKELFYVVKVVIRS